MFAARTPELDAAGGVESSDEQLQRRHAALMDLLTWEADAQREERLQAQRDEDYNDHLQYTPEDAAELVSRGQSPVVFNEARQTIDWISGMEKRMRKDYKILPREPSDEAGAEVKTKLFKYTEDVNKAPWMRSKAFKQAVVSGLSWLEEGINTDPEQEMVFSGWEDWRNVYRDSRSKQMDLSDARYLFRRKVVDLDYALALIPGKAEHLRAMAGRHDEDTSSDDVWYLGEKLTGSTELDFLGMDASFGHRSAYVARDAWDAGRRSAVELLECWYRVPESVDVFSAGDLAGRAVDRSNPDHQAALGQRLPTYKAVRMSMRVMIATRQAPLWDGPSPFRHGKFLLVPVWAYRRYRDGQCYGVMRGMRDIQDDLNKRRSKALYVLSSNRIVMDEDAVDDIEDLRQEAARPDALIVKKQGKELRFEKPMGDYAANLDLAREDAMIMRNVGGVTNENLGQNTNATSGRAILAKQDQGTLTTLELFDNYLLAFKLCGELRLSHIEQFWSHRKAVRIVGEGKPTEWVVVNDTDPVTGERLNDITARQADFVVDSQDYRASLAQAAMEQVFDLLGKIATFEPRVVMSVLDLVVDTAEIKNKDEWLSRIRELNGQRDPTRPMSAEEEQQRMAAKQAQAEVEGMNREMLGLQLEEMRKKLALLDVDGALKRVESMYAALQAAQIVATVPHVTPAADEITKSAGLVDQNPGPIPTPTSGPSGAPPGMPGQLAADSEPPEAKAALMGLDGVGRGIETPTGTDNLQPNVGSEHT